MKKQLIEQLFDNGKIVDVEIHTVTLPNGETSTKRISLS